MYLPNTITPLSASFFFFFLLLLRPLSATSHLLKLTTEETHHHQNPKPLLPSLHPSPPQPPPKPTTFFEVTRPIAIPPHSNHCSTPILHHNFANTYGQPPITSPFSPCHSHPPSLILLHFSASCIGRQFDRILGVWASGVELLRSCTAEPRPNGILWSFSKDITRFSSLLSSPQTISVYLANVVDHTYTGVYHVNLTFHFYWNDPPNSQLGSTPIADLVLPISRHPIPSNDGLWFRLHNTTDVKSKKLTIPRNSYRAVLEIFLSFHEDDEFWYSNPPSAYVLANNLTGTPGNGPFREVVATMDGLVVGAICPFTVIHTGGINPLLWCPITGIGSFDLPSYRIEITPFLGSHLLDGKPHTFGFAVTNSLDVWFVDGNLHLWLDEKSSRTTGKLLQHNSGEVVPSLVSKFRGLDGTFETQASRRLTSSGWVRSSHGKITTLVFQDFFRNTMVFDRNGSVQVINQTIRSNQNVYAKNSNSVVHVEEISREFPLYLYTGSTDVINGSYRSISNLSFSFDERKVVGGRGDGFSFSSLKNLQDGYGEMKVKGRLVQSGVGRTNQSYRYEGADGCYFRDVRSDNYTVLRDESGVTCSMDSKSRWLISPENKWASFL